MKQSAYKDLVAALTSILMRPGVSVGSTAGYPRVEIHSVIENERLDKDGKIRMLTATIESMTTDSMIKAHELNEANLALIQGLALNTNCVLIGKPIADQMQSTSESTDAQTTIYRIIQSVNFYIETK